VIEPAAAELRRDLADVMGAAVPTLSDRYPSLPDELPDRAADVWEPLAAIADVAGHEWPKRARGAARTLTLEDGDSDGSITELVLADIRQVLNSDDRVASDSLCRRLAALEESPWRTWHGHGIDARGFPRLLRHHGIRPQQLWISGENVRRYRADDFADAWARYLPAPSARPLEPLGPLPSNGNGPSRPNALADDPGGSDLRARVAAEDATKPENAIVGLDLSQPNPDVRNPTVRPLTRARTRAVGRPPNRRGPGRGGGSNTDRASGRSAIDSSHSPTQRTTPRLFAPS
jgi:hypothetical protein